VGLFRNIERIFEDVAPIAAALAPAFIPGPLGFIASAALTGISRNNPSQPAQQVAAQQVFARQQCPPMGVPRGGFSGPFRSAFFPSGGALAGRGLAGSFFAGNVLGRPQAQGCPPVSCACPGQQPMTRFAQPVLPVKGQAPSAMVSPQAFIQAPVPSVPSVFDPALGGAGRSTFQNVQLNPAFGPLAGAGRSSFQNIANPFTLIR